MVWMLDPLKAALQVDQSTSPAVAAGGSTPMPKPVHDATTVVADDPEDLADGLDELCRLAAQDMLKMALLAERRAPPGRHRRWRGGGPSPSGRRSP
jgi:hypothetical protein